jgi:hypothetical protein
VASVAGRPTTNALPTPHLPPINVAIISKCDTLVLRRAALMLALQVGRQTPDTLPSPDPSMGSLRAVLVPRSAPVSFLYQGNMDIRLLGRRPAPSSSSLCCRAHSLLRAGRCILVACYISQPLGMARVSRFGPITGSGVGGRWLTKGARRWPLQLFNKGVTMILTRSFVTDDRR